jgi:spore maturation protein SpmB
VMNLSANLLGLGNAATPFGLKAMRELDSLNDKKGVATNSMILFLGINSAGLALIPTSTIALRASLGSKNAAAILIPTLVATLCSTLAVILASKWLQRRSSFSMEQFEGTSTEIKSTVDSEALKNAEAAAAKELPAQPWKQLISIAALLAIALAAFQTAKSSTLSPFESLRALLDSWTLPVLILTFVLLGFSRGVNLYATFVSAAKEGFQTAIGVIPFLVGMLVSIGMFRASGAMGVLVDALTPLVSPFGFPAEALPMALIRPLSGSGANGVMSDIMKTHGADSFLGYLVSVLNGSTETTFYVIALYFGSIGIKHMRHGLLTCLVADFVGPMAAFVVCRFYFG